MGHANLKNISQTANKMLRENESVSIKEIVAELTRRKQTVHASEGSYDDDYMLAFACEQVINFLLLNECVESVKPTRRQKQILRQWDTDAMVDWDCGLDGGGGEYAVLDSVKWRALKRNLPLLRHITN